MPPTVRPEPARPRRPRGTYTTPLFMPVGTRGAIKYLSAADYERIGAQIVLGNTYHLMLRPGADLIERFGGLGSFAGWDGLTLTDSGGFQVFSLDPEGRRRRGHVQEHLRRLDACASPPRIAVRVQEQLGADIQMVLDQCPPLPSPPEVVRQALERTTAWAQRAKQAHTRPDQALFGIVAGWHLRGDARRERPAHRRDRLRRLRHRRAVGR